MTGKRPPETLRPTEEGEFCPPRKGCDRRTTASSPLLGIIPPRPAFFSRLLGDQPLLVRGRHSLRPRRATLVIQLETAHQFGHDHTKAGAKSLGNRMQLLVIRKLKAVSDPNTTGNARRVSTRWVRVVALACP